METKVASRLKVAMLTHGYLPCVGGAELQLSSLVPLLRNRGIDVHILTRSMHALPAFEQINLVPVHRLPASGPKWIASLSFTVSALSLIQKLRPDVIHAHALLSPTTTAIMAKRLFRIPVVAKVLRGGILGDLDRLKSKPFASRRITMLTNHVDAFISISHEIEAELSEIGILESRRPFIPNGVDTERFAPVSAAEKRRLRERLGLPDVPIVIYTGRLVPEKRVDQLVTMWPSIRNTQENALLLILGDGEEMAKLKSLRREGVELPGRCENVAPYLQAADLFVLPSATEGLSNALLEALSCGLPSIATAVGGATDVISHGREGWIVPPDQPRMMEHAIVTLLSDSAGSRQLGAQGRQKILSHYSLQATADRLANVYRQIAHG